MDTAKSDFKVAREKTQLAPQEEVVQLDVLAGLTGFPKEFIQSELSLSSAYQVSIKELRVSMLRFLDTKLGEFK